MMQTHQRIHSIDAFRGCTLAGMLLVNLPGSWSHLYPPLQHAQWHGWTPTDFVFPFFLFAMGLSMAFSFEKRRENAESSSLWRHILKRSFLLYLIGILLNAYPHFTWSKLRIPGVLQRLALAYIIASTACLMLRWRGLVRLSVCVLLLYWLMLSGSSVPGYGVGQLTPEGNVGAYFDRLLLGGHLYREHWDPEGLLGTLPSAVNIWLGYLTALFMRSTSIHSSEQTNRLFVGGWLFILLGLFWGIFFPINKKLWTSSYVIFSSGAALQLLAICNWSLDVQKHKKLWQPALIFGSNALVLFILHILYIKITRVSIRFPLAKGKTISLYHWIYLHGFASWAGPLRGSLLFALVHVVLFYALARMLYRKQIWIKI